MSKFDLAVVMCCTCRKREAIHVGIIHGWAYFYCCTCFGHHYNPSGVIAGQKCSKAKAA